MSEKRVFCTKCREEYSSNELYCPVCGTRLTKQGMEEQGVADHNHKARFHWATGWEYPCVVCGREVDIQFAKPPHTYYTVKRIGKKPSGFELAAGTTQYFKEPIKHEYYVCINCGGYRKTTGDEKPDPKIGLMLLLCFIGAGLGAYFANGGWIWKTGVCLVVFVVLFIIMDAIIAKMETPEESSKPSGARPPRDPNVKELSSFQIKEYVERAARKDAQDRASLEGGRIVLMTFKQYINLTPTSTLPADVEEY